jgi:hypothetical protein
MPNPVRVVDQFRDLDDVFFPSFSRGGIPYFDEATGMFYGVASGTDGHILTLEDGVPKWKTNSAAAGTVTGSGTATRIAFWSGASSLSSDADLYWNSGSNQLELAGDLQITPQTSGGIKLLPYGTSTGDTSELRFYELVANGSSYVGFKAPSNLSGNTIFVLPSTDGSNGQMLVTNGSGTLGWSTISTSGEANTGSNIGSGYGWFSSKVGADLQFRGILQGTGIALTSGAADITVALGNHSANFITSDNLAVARMPLSGTWALTGLLSITGNVDLTPVSAPTLQFRQAFGTTSVGIYTGSSAHFLALSPTSGSTESFTQMVGQTFGTTAYRGEIGHYLGGSGYFRVAQRASDATLLMVARTGPVGIGSFFTNTNLPSAASLHVAAPAGEVARFENKSTGAGADVSYISNAAGGNNRHWILRIEGSAGNLTWRDETASTNKMRLETGGRLIVPGNGTGAGIQIGGEFGAMNSLILAYTSAGEALTATTNSGDTILTLLRSGKLALGVGSGTPSYSLHVAPTSNTTSGQTVFFQDATSGTGVTRVVVKAGAAQASLSLMDWQANGGSVLASLLPTALLLNPHGTSAGNTFELRFGELAASGTNYVGFKAADGIASNVIWTLPIADGTSGQVLSTNGSGVLSWATASGVGGGEANTASNLGSGLGVWSVKSGVDLQFKSLVQGTGMALSATSGEITIALGNHSAALITSGTLAAARGGTGLSTFAQGSLLAASAADTWAALAIGTSGKVLTTNGTDPSWNLLTNTNIDAAAAIDWTKISKTGSSLADLTTRSASDLSTGTLAQARGGTGLSTYASGEILYVNGSGNLARLSPGTAGDLLTMAAGLPSWSASTSPPYAFMRVADQGGAVQFTASGSTTVRFATAGGLAVTFDSGTNKVIYSLDVHTHDAGEIVTGNLNVARLPTGGTWDLSTPLVLYNDTAGTGYTELAIRAGANQPTQSMLTVTNLSGTVEYLNVRPEGIGIRVPATEMLSILLQNGQMTMWQDEATPLLHFKVKESGGTVNDFQLPLGLTTAVTSLSKSGSSALNGAITLSEGANISLVQAGQDIQIATSGLALASHNHDASAITSGTLVQGRGGTGLSTYTSGDILYVNGAGNLAKLAAGTNGHVLTLASGLPSWAAGSGGSSFVNIANGAGVTQFSASGSDTLRFAAGTGLTASFTSGTKTVTYTIASHNHDASEITTGKLDIARFPGSGTWSTSGTVLLYDSRGGSVATQLWLKGAGSQSSSIFFVSNSSDSPKFVIESDYRMYFSVPTSAPSGFGFWNGSCSPWVDEGSSILKFQVQDSGGGTTTYELPATLGTDVVGPTSYGPWNIVDWGDGSYSGSPTDLARAEHANLTTQRMFRSGKVVGLVVEGVGDIGASGTVTATVTINGTATTNVTVTLSDTDTWAKIDYPTGESFSATDEIGVEYTIDAGSPNLYPAFAMVLVQHT